MASNKKFYWIKLKTDFFNLDEIDFLLSQKNGCEYIVLYQMICLKTANNGGRLCTEIGEMIIPFDIDKIVRETKYFDFDTVAVALELFKKLGLIYEQGDNILKIAAIDEMVGSETASAQRVRKHRENKALQCNTDVTVGALQCNIEIENREKSIDIENKDIEKKNKDKIIAENFEKLWKLLKSTQYDRKSAVTKKRKKELYEMGFDRAKKAIEVYLQVQNPEYYYKRDRFFNEIIDNYLDKEVSDFKQDGNNQNENPYANMKMGLTV